MRRPGRTGRIMTVAAAFALGGLAVVGATGDVREVDRPAVVDAVAQRLTEPTEPGDAVSVFEIGDLTPALSTLVASTASRSGASWAPVRSASVGMLGVRRGATDRHRAPAGFRFPLVLTSMPAAAFRGVMGPEVARATASGGLVVGRTTADRWRAAPGDLVEIVAADRSVRAIAIAAVVDDVVIGGAEAVLSTSTAEQLGIRRVGRAVMWGFSSRTAVERAVRATGIADRAETRAVYSWGPRNPDSTLSTARTKALLGEFAFRVEPDGRITQEPGWVSANLPAAREVLHPTIAIRARCHLRIRDDLRAALAEVAAAGLASTIDVANANRFGGCHYPRYNRISAEFGFLSRHAWGMALDTNTVTDCQGCVPRMDCRVVRIFRKHGFAWGGNFLRPDGMHFEWVGERRDLLPYRSRYCPNTAPVTAAGGEVVAAADESDRARAWLFADDTVAVEHDHASPHARADGDSEWQEP